MFATELSDWSDNGTMHVHSKMAKVFKSNRMVETTLSALDLYSQPSPGCGFKYIQYDTETGAEGLLADLVS